jgi:hypothetical protein
MDYMYNEYSMTVHRSAFGWTPHHQGAELPYLREKLHRSVRDRDSTGTEAHNAPI